MRQTHFGIYWVIFIPGFLHWFSPQNGPFVGQNLQNRDHMDQQIDFISFTSILHNIIIVIVYINILKHMYIHKHIWCLKMSCIDASAWLWQIFSDSLLLNNLQKNKSLRRTGSPGPFRCFFHVFQPGDFPFRFTFSNLHQWTPTVSYPAIPGVGWVEN